MGEGGKKLEKLKTMKTFTAGQLFKAKGCRIGKDIHDIYDYQVHLYYILDNERFNEL